MVIRVHSRDMPNAKMARLIWFLLPLSKAAYMTTAYTNDRIVGFTPLTAVDARYVVLGIVGVVLLTIGLVVCRSAFNENSKARRIAQSLRLSETENSISIGLFVWVVGAGLAEVIATFGLLLSILTSSLTPVVVGCALSLAGWIWTRPSLEAGRHDD